MKSYDVTIQMNPFQQYFHMVLFIFIIISILQNEFWDSSWILIVGTFGSERVKVSESGKIAIFHNLTFLNSYM